MTVAMNYGCQTYTWQMSYEKYADRLEHILDVVAAAGFCGVEAEVCMLGKFYADPALLASVLAARNLHLAALTLALPWRGEGESKEEYAEAERLLDYMGAFPGAKLILVNLPEKDRNRLEERQRNALLCVNAVGKRAYGRGIVSALHPNSPPGSVFRTQSDYDVMFAGLDTRYVGYCPDSGHIANGGMDPFAVFSERLPLIRHVHFKDISADKRWEPMGAGVIDHPGIMRLLRDNSYSGWIMVEEESEEAEREPDPATLHNGSYMTKQWLQLMEC
jgi:inosose dehydratase